MHQLQIVNIEPHVPGVLHPDKDQNLIEGGGCLIILMCIKRLLRVKIAVTKENVRVNHITL
jgi:hypothetical protein